MSVSVQAWVYQYSETRLADRLVLLAIADEADDEGYGYPSLRRIAHKARVSLPTAHAAVARIEVLGELEVTRPEKVGRGRFNTYRVLMATPQNVQEPEPSDRSGMFRNVQESSAQACTDPLTHLPTNPRDQDQEHSRDCLIDEDFEQWWLVYPRKVDKARARVKYRARRRAGVTHEQLTAAAVNYAAAKKGTEEQYVKHAATFLNGSWEEYVQAPEPADPRSKWDRLAEADAARIRARAQRG